MSERVVHDEAERSPSESGISRIDLLAPEPDKASVELIKVLEAELRRASEPHRVGRLHYELAQCYEHMLAEHELALAEYREALALIPDHLPSLRGAYRAAIALGRELDACDILRAETEHTSDPVEGARVRYRLGRLYEQGLDDIAAARESYEAAFALCPNEPTYLKTLERVYRRVEDWAALSSVLEERANLAGDIPHRVALTVERARLHEARLEDRATAAELYQAAQALMPEAPGVVEALVRLHRGNANVSGLIAALEQAAALAEDPRDRAEQRYHRGRIQSERLGDRVSAIESLEAAVKDAPDEPLLVDALAELHRKAGNHSRLAELLRQRVDVTVDAGERAALLHRLGQVLESNGEVGQAIAAYQEAVALAPTCVPALQALGARLAEKQDWESLVAMHRAEAEAVQSTRRRASAHRRMGELLERRLSRPAEAAEQYALALTLEPGDPGAFKALVRLWAELGEHRKLIEIYERAVDETTSTARKIAYLFKVGGLWEDALDEPAQAIGAYTRVLELADRDLGAIHALQRVCERAERYSDLVDYLLLEADLADDETLVLALRQRAAEVLDEHLQDPDRARVLLEQILANDPGHLPAVIALGRIHYRAGRWRELLLMYDSELAVTADARDRAILQTRMGELCEQKFGDVDEAIAHYERAAEDDPTYRPATTALLRLLTESGDRSALLDRLQARVKVLNTPAERAQLALQMAHLLEDDGDLDGAIECCRAALAEEPQYRSAARALERLLEHAERNEELEHLLEAEADTAAGPRRALVSALRRGELLRAELHQPDKAIDAYRVAREAGAKLSALVPLAALYAQTARVAELIEVETEVAGEVDQRPERAAALREVARLLGAREGDEDGDLLYTVEAILLVAPEDPDALLLLAELAAEAGDADRLVRALARLGRVSSNAELAGDYWLRLAQVYEAAGDERAVATYRSVLEKVPNSLAAALGLERVAERAFDSETQAYALRCQAAILGDAQTAAERLVASAELDTDAERSVAALERALELWPDSARAAAAIARALGDDDERERLIDLLSRAAGAAREPERRAALWHDVARAYASQGELGAAIAAVKRGLVAVSDDLACLDLLAQLYGDNDQWNEAIAVLSSVASAESASLSARRDALVRQAELSEEKLGKPDLALARAREALELEPLNRSVLALVAQLENANGRSTEAEAIARDLLSVSSGPGEQADALCVLGEIEAGRGSVAGATVTLAKAVAITGASGRAYTTMRRLVGDSGDWHALAAALEDALRAEHELDDPAATHLALADVYVKMQLPGKAVAALEHGFADTRDRRLAARLAQLIPKASPALGAAEQLRVLLEHVAGEPALWRAMARCAHEAGRIPDARRAVSALAALSALQPGDDKLAVGDQPRTGDVVANSIDAVALNAATPHGAAGRPVAGVVAALAEALARVEVTYSPASLTRKERVPSRSKHPLSPLFDRLLVATGLQAELYVRAGLHSPAVAICSDTPVVLADEALASRPVAEQCFLLARPLVLATLRLHPVIAISARSLESVVAEVAGLNGGETELAKQLRKAVPRRQRKPLELALTAYAQQPEVDFAGWRRAIVQGANRVASLLADDVGAAVAALAYVRDEGAPPPPKAGPRRSVIADLLGFWLSDTAQQLRQRSGI